VQIKQTIVCTVFGSCKLHRPRLFFENFKLVAGSVARNRLGLGHAFMCLNVGENDLDL